MDKLKIIIRQEQPYDYDEVYRLVKESFLTENHTEEPDYLDALRTKPEFIPGLSLVAETDDGTIAGQIVLYQTTINYNDSQDVQLVVSPLSVLPLYFRRGVGSALLREGLKIGRETGYKAAFLMGDPGYYSRFGFMPSYKFNIFHKDYREQKVDFIMAYQLYENALDGKKGIIDIY